MNETAAPSLLLLPLRLLGIAWLHLRRAFMSNLQKLPVTEEERKQLLAAGVQDRILQQYAVWRRSVLWFVMLPTALGAVLYTLRTTGRSFEGFSSIGKALVICDAMVLYVLPLSALFAALSWTHQKKSHRVLFYGWLFAFLFPILYALCPLGLQFELSTDLHEREVQRNLLVAYGLLIGIGYYVALMPTVMSLIPGLLRACVRLKTLVPAFIVPGWFLIAGAPLYLLLWLVVFVAINHFAGNALLIFGVLLWIGAPMIYVFHSDRFLRPLGPVEGGRSIAQVQKIVNVCLTAGTALLVTYALTKKIFGISILGFVQEDSLAWMLENYAAFAEETKVELERMPTSLVWIGDMHIYRYLLEYLGRSLFMTVMFADLLMRLERWVWHEEKRFFQTEAAAEFDQFMEDLTKVYGVEPEVTPGRAGDLSPPV